MSESKSKTAKRNIRILKDLESMTQKEAAEKYNLSTASIKAIKAKANAAAGNGLGDVVEKITEATGIKKAVKFLAGEDCGCTERKEKMNIAFPTRRTIECMTEEMYDTFGRIKGLSSLGSSERAEVARIHAHVFKHKVVVPCTCSPKRWAQFMSELTKVYDSY